MGVAVSRPFAAGNLTSDLDCTDALSETVTIECREKVPKPRARSERCERIGERKRDPSFPPGQAPHFEDRYASDEQTIFLDPNNKCPEPVTVREQLRPRWEVKGRHFRPRLHESFPPRVGQAKDQRVGHRRKDRVTITMVQPPGGWLKCRF